MARSIQRQVQGVDDGDQNAAMGGKQHIVLGQVTGHAALNPRVKVGRRLNARVGLIPKTDPAFRTRRFTYYILKLLAVEPRKAAFGQILVLIMLQLGLQA